MVAFVARYIKNQNKRIQIFGVNALVITLVSYIFNTSIYVYGATKAPSSIFLKMLLQGTLHEWNKRFIIKILWHLKKCVNMG